MQSLKSSILSKDSAHANTIWIHAIELAMQSKYNDERRKNILFAGSLVRLIVLFSLLDSSAHLHYSFFCCCCTLLWVNCVVVCVCEGIAISGEILQLTDLSNFQFKQIPCYFLDKIISSFQLVVIVLNRLHSNFSVYSARCGLYLSFFLQINGSLFTIPIASILMQNQSAIAWLST